MIGRSASSAGTSSAGTSSAATSSAATSSAGLAARPSARPSARLAWLDALRGLAALAVVFDHASMLVVTSTHSFLYQWFNFGQYGVFVFFLVSGYIIPASLERKGSIRGFWISRGFRLYPLYVLAIIASGVGYELGYGTLRGAQHHPVQSAAADLLMLPNVLGGPNVPNVTWTLSYEMVFYLLLAALFSVRAHRASGGYAVASAIVVVTLGGILPMGALNNGIGPLGPRDIPIIADALILAGIGLAVSGRRMRGGSWLAAGVGLLLLTINQDHYPLPWSGYTILALMFTGTVIYRAESGQVARWKAAVIAVVVLAMTVGGGLWHGAQHPDWGTAGAQWQWQWMTSLVGAALTFGVGLLLRERRVPRILAWLGMISYSVYLLHPLILDAFRDVPTLHHASRGLVVQLPLAAGLIGVVIASSAATYYLVEKPMQRLGHKVAKRWDRPQTRSGTGSDAASGAGDVAADGMAVGTVAVGAQAARSASINKTVAGGSGGSP
jgi:peptidoglycan/LPS O-acetylase OafA/YrhL